MGIITSKRKPDTRSCTGTISDTRYEKLLEEDSTICDEKSPCVLGKELTSIKPSEQIVTVIAVDDSSKPVEKQTKSRTRSSKSLTGQQTSNHSTVNKCNGHLSNFSIPIEAKSLFENPLFKRADAESGALKPVNPFRIGKEKDKERIELFESGLVNPHNRAGILKHEIDPKEEEIIGELKGIGIISNKEGNASEKTKQQNLGKVLHITEIPVEIESIEENVHLLTGLSETSLETADTKNDNATSEVASSQRVDVSPGDGMDNAYLALKMINMEVL